jgi:diaminohydroxyphosphoribosylaminopyrimidine deaminase/5-amino-6-(5-phosphoribosylamino)uracil reductase
MRQALQLARRAYGHTSPNPMVGAVVVKAGNVLSRGWHRHAGLPHAEIEALHGIDAHGATLYVTLEPCCTHGRTLPCTEAIIKAGVSQVVVAAIDPNPKHHGKGLAQLRRAGIKVIQGPLEAETTELNAAFNHWIVHRTPLITLKAAMSLDGKIATHTGESKWITGDKARAYAMHLRQGADAILVGVNTIIRDDPSLTIREIPRARTNLRRIVLDSRARTPLHSQILRDDFAGLTTVVVSPRAPKQRLKALRQHVNVWAETDLKKVLAKLGAENVTHLLVEGGGQINASFFESRLAHRIAFFYAPKVIGGRDAIKAVAGKGATRWQNAIQLRNMVWKRLGADLLLTADVDYTPRA